MDFPFGKSFLFFCFSVCLCKILFILDSSDRKNLQMLLRLWKFLQMPYMPPLTLQMPFVHAS